VTMLIQRLHVWKQLQDRRAIFRLDDATHFGLTAVKSLFGFPLNLVCLVASVQLLARANDSVPSGVQVALVAALTPVRSPSRVCCFLGLSCDCCRRRSLRTSLYNTRARRGVHRPLLRGLRDPRTRHGRIWALQRMPSAARHARAPACARTRHTENLWNVSVHIAWMCINMLNLIVRIQARAHNHCTCIYTCIYIHIYMHMHMHVQNCTHACAHDHLYVHTCMHTSTHMYTWTCNMHTRAHTCSHIYTHVLMHMHVCTPCNAYSLASAARTTQRVRHWQLIQRWPMVRRNGFGSAATRPVLKQRVERNYIPAAM
jgi:hypothetical protein